MLIEGLILKVGGKYLVKYGGKMVGKWFYSKTVSTAATGVNKAALAAQMHEMATTGTEIAKNAQTILDAAHAHKLTLEQVKTAHEILKAGREHLETVHTLGKIAHHASEIKNEVDNAMTPLALGLGLLEEKFVTKVETLVTKRAETDEGKGKAAEAA